MPGMFESTNASYCFLYHSSIMDIVDSQLLEQDQTQKGRKLQKPIASLF